jgi:hypothetical protein
VSSFSGKGELDILYPALTVFHGFDVNAGSVDLRTIEYLYPSFPRLKGSRPAWHGSIRRGSTFDSRTRGDACRRNVEPSHFTGSGRITYGDPFMLYDVN